MMYFILFFFVIQQYTNQFPFFGLFLNTLTITLQFFGRNAYNFKKAIQLRVYSIVLKGSTCLQKLATVSDFFILCDMTGDGCEMNQMNKLHSLGFKVQKKMFALK